jgi:hypothetical protein
VPPSSLVEIETNVPLFLSRLKDWNSHVNQPPFPSVVASAILHAFGCLKSREFVRGLRRKLGIGELTLAVWAQNLALPVHEVRNAVVAFIAEFISAAYADMHADRARAQSYIKRAEDACR